MCPEIQPNLAGCAVPAGASEQTAPLAPWHGGTEQERVLAGRLQSSVTLIPRLTC